MEASPNVPAWKSKTLWAALIVAVAPVFPPAQALIAANPEIVGAIVGGIFAVLRVFTSKPVLKKKHKA